MTPEQAAKVYDVLVRECGADPTQALGFIQYMTSPQADHLGGKLYVYSHVWRVDCYPEDTNPTRRLLMSKVNDMIGHIEAGRSL